MISYLDAGTGSMIVTAVAGGFAGIAVAGKMAIRRFKSKLTGKAIVEEQSSDSDDDTPEANA